MSEDNLNDGNRNFYYPSYTSTNTPPIPIIPPNPNPYCVQYDTFGFPLSQENHNPPFLNRPQFALPPPININNNEEFSTYIYGARQPNIEEVNDDTQPPDEPIQVSLSQERSQRGRSHKRRYLGQASNNNSSREPSVQFPPQAPPVEDETIKAYCWNYFRPIRNEDGILTHAICKLCGKEYRVSSSGTSSMNKHIGYGSYKKILCPRLLQEQARARGEERCFSASGRFKPKEDVIEEGNFRSMCMLQGLL